jgi:hypothetical protein
MSVLWLHLPAIHARAIAGVKPNKQIDLIFILHAIKDP